MTDTPNGSATSSRADEVHQPLVEDALGKQMRALLIQLETACTAADDLAETIDDAFLPI
ncbi:hypothetical protein [Streptomyces sp. NPDC005231]|uniref:hypothetical protein n=1 Tax=Streptomyces sp. NPDC005231 TaxID=3157026 RepID=UPI0033BE9C36